jgi:SAM-dependent methyltransferase
MSDHSVQMLSQIITDYSNSSDHPDLQVYRRDVEQFDWDRFDWWIRHIAKLGNFYGNKRILEIGCGFGWEAVALSIETGASVVAMDILPSMIAGVSECLDTMRTKGKKFKVEPLVGDICKVDLPPDSFDGLFSSEAVEHVHNLEQMYGRCFALLKKGGKLVIANDSNGYNGLYRARNMEMWPERDGSWEHVEWLKREVRPREHANAEPYAVMRERMIRAGDPTLPAEDVRALVHATAGLIEPEIQAATRACKADGTLPQRPEWSWCRNPETGEYAERLLDPFEMADGLKAAGFKVSLQHGMRKFPVRLINKIGIRFINKQIFERKPLFIIVAEKP